jgi:hypothetical protein
MRTVHSILLHIAVSAICMLSIVPICLAKDYVTINSNPPGATVEIDGIVVGKLPIEWKCLADTCMALEAFSANSCANRRTFASSLMDIYQKKLIWLGARCHG